MITTVAYVLRVFIFAMRVRGYVVGHGHGHDAKWFVQITDDQDKLPHSEVQGGQRVENKLRRNRRLAVGYCLANM